MFDEFWHRRLRRPYYLHKQIDTGQGAPVVLLHGIGRSSRVWLPLVSKLRKQPFRLIAFDLLGFGDSPKPEWLDYSIDDQAKAIIASIGRLRLRQPILLVGHSMGSLAALRVARLRPDLVRHAILYEMPLYEGLPEKRRYTARLKVYFAFYEWVTRQQPSFGEAKKRFGEKLASKVAGSELTPETWQPFIKSLRNSIMTQTAADDIKHLRAPAEVVYGSRDMLVIRGKVENIFGKDATNITAHTIKARHTISAEVAAFLAERITAASQQELAVKK